MISRGPNSQQLTWRGLDYDDFDTGISLGSDTMSVLMETEGGKSHFGLMLPGKLGDFQLILLVLWISGYELLVKTGDDILALFLCSSCHPAWAN